MWLAKTAGNLTSAHKGETQPINTSKKATHFVARREQQSFDRKIARTGDWQTLIVDSLS